VTASKSAGERVLHGRRWRRCQSRAPIALRKLVMSAASVQVGKHRGPQVGAGEPGWRLQPFKDREALDRSLQLCHRDRTIQPVDRGGRELFQQRIAFDNPIPARLRKRFLPPRDIG